MSAPPTVLARILEETRAEVQRRKAVAETAAAVAEDRLPPPATQSPRRGFAAALRASGIGVIAEFKRRSPSAGTLREAPDLAATLAAYERGGAVAASILTEGPNFGGSLDDLRAARGACALPLLRKDFVVDPFQIREAAAAGADAVLLIVAALEDAQLGELKAAAEELGLDTLVEVHDAHELERALALGGELIGINNRDLRDFSVDVSRTESLLDAIPSGVIVVSESGISSREQLERLRALGVQAVLVGETLMRAPDPAAALADLRPA
jgi:indole-3-glycerol phosphate synthase